MDKKQDLSWIFRLGGIGLLIFAIFKNAQKKGLNTQATLQDAMYKLGATRSMINLVNRNIGSQELGKADINIETIQAILLGLNNKIGAK